MLKNYFLVALRTIKRNKIYSTINIFGLSLGIASSILILMWVNDELSYNSSHENLPSIFRVMENQHYSDRIGTTSSTPGPLSPYLKATYPEVKYASRLTWPTENLFNVEEASYYESGRYVDADFMEMFTFKFIEGSASTAFNDKNAVVLTETMAKKYFGNAPAMDQVFRMNNKESMKVTGVVEDWPKNSDFGGFAYLLNFDKFMDENKQWLDQWGNNNVSTFVQLQSGQDWEAYSTKINRLLDEKNDENNIELFLYPATKMHLYGSFENGVQDGGRIRYVKIFGIIAIFLLLIACINFMNLSTALAVKRSKEVALRKVVGAFRKHLIYQFLTESIVFSALGGLAAAVLVIVLMPFFNEISDKSLVFEFNTATVLLFSGTILFTGFVGGSYPAFYIARFEPAKVLKGQLKSGKAAVRFRKVLVTTQFVLSIIMIFCTVVVYQQLWYVQNQDTGFNKEGIIYMEMQENMAEKYDLIQDQLLKDPSILSVSESSFSPLSIGNSTWGLDWPGKDPQERILFSNFAIDGSYIETMGLTLVGGRTFDKTMATDTANIIINESAARKMGFEPLEAVDQPITVWGERKGHIIGVVKDYNYSSSHSVIRPMFMMFEKDWCSYIIVRAKPQQYTAAIDALNSVHTTYAPAYPFEYRFLDVDWAEFYENEERTGQLFQGFAWLSIFISCLGLFGLAAFAIQQRTKEIGVRKVLGASTSSIITLTVKDFALLVIIAAVIGSPLAWYLMDQWLTDFAFHVNISVMVPLAAMLLALFIAVVTVGFHSIRAARTNPVDALRYE
ncbi:MULTISPECIES: ABC transporter permease [unclassified Imperialibacter]|uniref:ABC transporter permease n=1 Tax=unclassified Imperialibacter TaxID=2629706 RepID=UPI0012565D72|nr:MULTISPECIES: ABC transporter permease [unclassified Imperialibacter]CAD5252757.1 ABC transporter permease [Imperialibacter sp. 75]CAD5280971.1 ABC transporter permease [Imperialibacter sp. 89]VVT28860.1 conserved membrane hypothetical protein [Imperialibacter sp. EC-SDR9]